MIYNENVIDGRYKIIFSFLLSTTNKGAIEITYFRTVCKTSTSLYTVLFPNERGKLWLNGHDFLVSIFSASKNVPSV